METNVSGNNNQLFEKSVVPEYSDIKGMYHSQFLVCQNLYSHYFLRPRVEIELQFRQSLIILATSLSFKLDVLSDDIESEKKYKDYFRFFLSRPDEFCSVDLALPFVICSLLLNKIGFFDVEQKKVSKLDTYKEVY